jgi:hypothetical protein
MTNYGDIRVDGGINGTAICLDDLERLCGLVSSAVESLDSAVDALARVQAYDAGVGVEPGLAECSEVVMARTRVTHAIEQAVASSCSARACRDEGSALEAALDGSIATYDSAEAAVTAKVQGMIRQQLGAVEILGILPPLAAAAKGALISTVMRLMADAVASGGCVADVLREHHLLVRELVDQLLIPGFGTPTVEQLTQRISAVGKVVYFMAGFRGASVTRGPMERSDVKPGLANLVDAIDAADRATKNEVPSIMVSRITSAGDGSGTPSWVISIPPTSGTIGGENPFDVVSDMQMMGEHGGHVVDGILEAMEDAGIRKGEKILFAGHSLGGLAAAAVASSAGFRERYSAPTVITLGSPIQPIPITKDTTVLAVEHRQDPLVALGGKFEEPSGNLTVITRDLAKSTKESELAAAAHPMGDGSHSRGFYRTTLAKLDDLDDPSVNDVKARVAAILPAGALAETTRYEIRRDQSGIPIPPAIPLWLYFKLR